MMKILALSLVTLMSLTTARSFGSTHDRVSGPGGPGGPPPPFRDACDRTYEGSYDNGSAVTFEFHRGPRGTWVTIYNEGQVWQVSTFCDDSGFEFTAGVYDHSGSFRFSPFGAIGLSGTEYYGARPVQRFSASVKF